MTTAGVGLALCDISFRLTATPSRVWRFGPGLLLLHMLPLSGYTGPFSALEYVPFYCPCLAPHLSEIGSPSL